MVDREPVDKFLKPFEDYVRDLWNERNGREEVSPDTLLKSTLDGLIPSPEDHDFDAFCEYIKLGK